VERGLPGGLIQLSSSCTNNLIAVSQLIHSSDMPKQTELAGLCSMQSGKLCSFQMKHKMKLRVTKMLQKDSYTTVVFTSNT